MMNLYMDLIGKHTREFKQKLHALDGFGADAEKRSQDFGQAVSILDVGLDNFKKQTKKFREVVSDNAKTKLVETSQALRAGEFNGKQIAQGLGGLHEERIRDENTNLHAHSIEHAGIDLSEARSSSSLMQVQVTPVNHLLKETMK